MGNRLVRMLTAVALVAMTGCATAFNGTREFVRVNSLPDNATIIIGEGSTGKRVFQGRTPAVISLRRSYGYFRPANYRITVKSPGFENQVFDLETTASGWYVYGNLILGGLVGWLVVDPATGGMWRISPDEITADFEKDQQSSNDRNTIRIATLDQIPASIRSSMVPIPAQPR